MWEREAEFTALLHSVQQRASRGSIDALAQMAVEDHKHVSVVIWYQAVTHLPRLLLGQRPKSAHLAVKLASRVLPQLVGHAACTGT